MAEIIESGNGNGKKAKVFKDLLLATRTVNHTEVQDANLDGRGWNINTGWISSISANSALLYFLNKEDREFYIDAIAVGIKNGSAIDVQSIYLIKNPTGGTLVSAATDCDMIENRRVGSSKVFKNDTLAYKATASGQTLTGGDDAALFAQNDQARLYATVDFVVEVGQAVGLRIETDGTFNGDVYAALIGHIVPDLED